MKKIILVLIFIISSFYFLNTNGGGLGIFTENADIIYCNDPTKPCSLSWWIDIVATWIDDIEKTDKASVYIQRIVIYLLTFVSLIAILYIIYAWFKILTSAGDEEVQKSQKKTIISVAVWIIIMWLAYAIVKFILTGIWA